MSDERTVGKAIDLMAALKASLHPEQVCASCKHVHDGPNGSCMAAIGMRRSKHQHCPCPSAALQGRQPEGIEGRVDRTWQGQYNGALPREHWEGRWVTIHVKSDSLTIGTKVRVTPINEKNI